MYPIHCFTLINQRECFTLLNRHLIILWYTHSFLPVSLSDPQLYITKDLHTHTHMALGFRFHFTDLNPHQAHTKTFSMLTDAGKKVFMASRMFTGHSVSIHFFLVHFYSTNKKFLNFYSDSPQSCIYTSGNKLQTLKTANTGTKSMVCLFGYVCLVFFFLQMTMNTSLYSKTVPNLTKQMKPHNTGILSTPPQNKQLTEQFSSATNKAFCYSCS